MTHRVALSIIVPVFKVEDTLDACLESIVGQSFADFQLVLVDDGSPDRCPAMCDEWAERDGRIRVVHKGNGGLSEARNAGIDVATGDYLMFVDSDDLLSPDTLAPLMQIVAERPEIDILEFPVATYPAAAQKTYAIATPQTYTDMRHYWLNGRAYEHAYACNKVYRRKLFAEVRFPVGRVFEDVHVLPQLLKRTTTLATTNRGQYIYRHNPQGITETAGAEEFAMFLDSHIAILRDLFPPSNASVSGGSFSVPETNVSGVSTSLSSDGSIALPQTPEACRYYMRVVDIQLLLSELTDGSLMLPQCRVALDGLSAIHKAKAVAINTIGLRRLCRINHLFRKIVVRKK